MKIVKLNLLIFLISFSLLANAQDKNDEQYNFYKSTYERALRYNDYAVAKNALYNMLSINPENDSAMYTLAYFYFDSKQYASSVLVGMDLIKKHPNDLNIVDILAESYDNLGIKQKALDNYEKLYLLGNDLNALYKTTFLQYDLKRYDECTTNIGILLSRKEVDSTQMVYTFEENKQQQFPMRVSVLTLRGLVEKSQGDKDAAKKSFEAALAIAPDFKLASQNLEILNKAGN